MPNPGKIEAQIFTVDSTEKFNELVLEIFRFQYENIMVYRHFVDYLQCKPRQVSHFSEIPFLPVEMFKTHKILARGLQSELVFTSSGTTGKLTSRHFVAHPDLYVSSISKGFRRFFGPPGDFVFLALLPSYLQQGGSSLVFMAEKLMELSGHPQNGFYLHAYEKLSATLQKLRNDGQKTMLLGVTYALLDLAEQFPLDFPGLYLVETGGMKGRRKEMVREELHAVLKKPLG